MNVLQVPTTTKYLLVGPVSQHSIIVQPKDAEACDYCAAMFKEAQDLAKKFNNHVVFIDKHGSRVTIKP